MRIINQKNNLLLAQHVEVADRFFTRSKGLLGRKELPAGEALIIKRCNSIHTFFMHFPIDVLFMDQANKVVMALSDIPAWRLSPVCFRANYVIELPAGTIRRTATLPGDILIHKPS